MKKLLAGCLIGVVLLLVAAGVAAYFAWRAVGPTIEGARQAVDGASRLAEVIEVDRGLVARGPYTGPASGELTPTQVERFLRVQARVKQALGSRAEAFREKYKALATTRPDGTEEPPSLAQLLAGLSDLSQIYVGARRAQVEALNAEGFSRAEFTWVRLRVYQAAGVEATRDHAHELQAALRAMADDARVQVPDLELPDAPAANRALVKPHTASLIEWLTMASFGL